MKVGDSNNDLREERRGCCVYNPQCTLPPPRPFEATNACHHIIRSQSSQFYFRIPTTYVVVLKVNTGDMAVWERKVIFPQNHELILHHIARF